MENKKENKNHRLPIIPQMDEQVNENFLFRQPIAIFSLAIMKKFRFRLVHNGNCKFFVNFSGISGKRGCQNAFFSAYIMEGYFQPIKRDSALSPHVAEINLKNCTIRCRRFCAERRNFKKSANFFQKRGCICHNF